MLLILFIRCLYDIRGFSRETFVEITGNIEAQEHMRENNGDDDEQPNHPRASTTDDVESFFAITHRFLGKAFTLKDFKSRFPKLVK